MASLPFSAIYKGAADAVKPAFQAAKPSFNAIKTGGGKVGGFLNHPITEQVGNVIKQAGQSFDTAARAGQLDKPFRNVVRTAKVGVALGMANAVSKNLSRSQFGNNPNNTFGSFGGF
jgi:hypothetical protein